VSSCLAGRATMFVKETFGDWWNGIFEG